MDMARASAREQQRRREFDRLRNPGAFIRTSVREMGKLSESAPAPARSSGKNKTAWRDLAQWRSALRRNLAHGSVSARLPALRHHIERDDALRAQRNRQHVGRFSKR